MTPFISKVGMDTRESAFVAIRLRLKADRFRNGWKETRSCVPIAI